MTTVEREAPEHLTDPQHDTIEPDRISMDTRGADDTDFEPTIVRGRE